MQSVGIRAPIENGENSTIRLDNSEKKECESKMIKVTPEITLQTSEKIE